MISELSNSVKLIDENETLNLTSWPRPRGLYDLHFSLFLSVALATLIFFGTLKLAQIYLYQAFKCVFFSLFCPFMAGLGNMSRLGVSFSVLCHSYCMCHCVTVRI